MTFSLYQSLRTVPAELIEAARMYHLSTWQRFWRLEVPHAVPGLVWNMMMSVSGGWFFVVASEAITVSGQTIMLPGVGSYIATAIEQRDLGAIGWARRWSCWSSSCSTTSCCFGLCWPGRGNSSAIPGPTRTMSARGF